VAVLAIERLRLAGWQRLSAEAIAVGVAACRWPGRLEWVELPNGQRVLLDAAHNSQGLAALVDYLDLSAEPFDLLLGVLEKKRVEDVLPRLVQRVGQITLTRPTGKRGRDPDSLRPLLGETPARVVEDPAEALDYALKNCTSNLLVSGSLHLIGEIRALIRRRFGVPPRTV
jgi:folylpolyglutamate synthase/dihydropteroate synthase